MSLKLIINNSIKNILFKFIKEYSNIFNKRIERQYLIHKKESFPLRIINNNIDDLRFNSAMANYENHLHKEWILDIKEPSLIEPEKGLVFSQSGKFLFRSFNYHILLNCKNFPFQSFFKIISNKSIKQIDTAFSLRDLNESNYWHFFDDEMSKLRLFDKIKLNENIPILVGKKLWQMDFFQYVIKNTGLKSYNWQLHSDIYKVNRIIIAVPSSLKTENFNFFLKKSGIVLKQEAPKRVFVNRSVKRGKTIQNLDELISILNKYSIKVVENDDLTFEDQITIYKDAEILIGIHGAGLVNLIYRINKPTGVFEIFHPNKINPHYFWMSSAFNFMYSYMVGDKVNSNDTFYIDPTVFEHKILEFIDSFEKQKLR